MVIKKYLMVKNIKHSKRNTPATRLFIFAKYSHKKQKNNPSVQNLNYLCKLFLQWLIAVSLQSTIKIMKMEKL